MFFTLDLEIKSVANFNSKRPCNSSDNPRVIYHQYWQQIAYSAVQRILSNFEMRSAVDFK